MFSEKVKLILFAIGFVIFVAMLFSESFVSTNVISTQEFPTVTGKDEAIGTP